MVIRLVGLEGPVNPREKFLVNYKLYSVNVLEVVDYLTGKV
jgi:hypothetical protein